MVFFVTVEATRELARREASQMTMVTTNPIVHSILAILTASTTRLPGTELHFVRVHFPPLLIGYVIGPGHSLYQTCFLRKFSIFLENFFKESFITLHLESQRARVWFPTVSQPVLAFGFGKNTSFSSLGLSQTCLYSGNSSIKCVLYWKWSCICVGTP